MVGELWKALLDYLKRTPYWPVLEPVLLIGFLYVGVCVVAYQYVQWRYQLTLDLALFLQSHLLRQVSVAFVAVVGIFVAITAGGSTVGKDVAPSAALEPEATPALPAHARRWLRLGLVGRAGVVLLICASALGLLQAWSPVSSVSPIRVRFAAFDAFGTGAPTSDPDASRQVAISDYQRLRAVTQYLLYEINHRQRAWQLEFEATPFRTDLVSKADEDRCASDDTPPLCIAEAFRGAMTRQRAYPPLMLILAQPLGAGGTRAWFWLNRGPVSVVTMSDWGGAASPGSIEFLAYALVVQSVTIHLQAYCGLAQPPAGTPEGVVVGNVFDRQPGIDAMRAAVLTGHFSPDDQRRLLNCFGPDYMQTAISLASLNWMRTAPVRESLRKVYGVDLIGG